MKSTAATAVTSTPGSTGSSDLTTTNNNNATATTTAPPPTLSPTPNGVVVNSTTNHTAPGPSTKSGGGGSIDDDDNNNNNSSSNNHHQHNTPQVASWTEETCSEGAFSRRSSDNGQAYEVIEYDYNDEHISSNNNNMNNGGKPYHHLSGLETDDTSELFAEVVGKTAVITIDDDSPAAAALRANAKIHVSSVGKAARAVQLQSVRRVLKRATGITKSGYKKGKPPRIPPTMLQQPSLSHVVSPGPVDVDQYMDAGEMTDHSNNNNNQDILIEGVDEDHADDDMGHDTTTMMLTTTCHDDANLTAVLHQHGIDEPSFSEIGGDDDHWMMGTTATAHRMDDRHNSRILATHPTTTAATTTKSSTSLLTSPPLPMHTDRDLLHIPDGVAPGTVEAGKKGR